MGQGVTNVLSMKASTLASLFAVEAHDECVRVTDLDKSSRSDAQSFMACAAFADPCTRISSQGKEDID